MSKLSKYSKARKEQLTEFPLCQARLDYCTRIATEVHHKKGRGIHLCDRTTFLSVCRSCHEWIELHPKEAKALGLSLSRLT